MVIRVKASKDRARTLVELALQTSPSAWVDELKKNEFVEFLVTKNVYQKSIDGSLSSRLASHKNFIITLFGGNPPPLVGSTYGFLDHNNYNKFVVDLTNSLYKYGKTEQDFDAMVTKVAELFKAWWYDSGTAAKWSETIERSLPEHHKWVIIRNSATAGMNKAYRPLLRDTLSVFLATFAFGLTEENEQVVRNSIDFRKWPDAIEYEAGGKFIAGDNAVSSLPLEAALSVSIRKHLDSNPSVRTQGLTETLQGIDKYSKEFESSVLGSAKFKDKSASITQTNVDTYKTIFVANLKEIIKILFHKELKYDDGNRIEHLSSLHSAMLSILASDSITFINLSAIGPILNYLIQYYQNLPKNDLSKIFDDLSIGGPCTEEPYDRLKRSEGVFFSMYPTPPLIKSDKKSPGPFSPPTWTEGELHKFLYTRYMQYAVSQMVSDWIDRLKGIFYVFRSDAQKLDFQRLVLDNISGNSHINEHEYHGFVKKICSRFDKLNFRSQEYYVELLQNREYMSQRKEEQMQDFLSRITYTQSLAYPNSYNSDVNRRLLCKFFFRGISSDRIRSHLQDHHPALVLDAGQAQELLRKACEKEDQLIRFQEEFGADKINTFNVSSQSCPRNQGRVSWAGPGEHEHQDTEARRQEDKSDDAGSVISLESAKGLSKLELKARKAEVKAYLYNLCRNKNLTPSGSLITPENEIPDSVKKSEYYFGPRHYVRITEFNVLKAKAKNEIDRSYLGQNKSESGADTKKGNSGAYDANYMFETTPTYGHNNTFMVNVSHDSGPIITSKTTQVTFFDPNAKLFDSGYALGKIMYDIGSRLSILSFEAWREVSRNFENVTLRPSSNQFFCVKGNYMDCLGVVILDVLVGSHTRVKNFLVHVVDIKSCYGLLGEDFRDELRDNHGGVYDTKFYHVPECSLFLSHEAEVDKIKCPKKCVSGNNFQVIAPFTDRTDVWYFTSSVLIGSSDNTQVATVVNNSSGSSVKAEPKKAKFSVNVGKAVCGDLFSDISPASSGNSASPYPDMDVDMNTGDHRQNEAEYESEKVAANLLISSSISKAELMAARSELRQSSTILESPPKSTVISRPNKQISGLSEDRYGPGPLKVVCLDIFSLNKDETSKLLIGVDVYSGFTFIEKIENEFSASIVNGMIDMFRFTFMPESVSIDSAALRSNKILTFLSDWNILLVSCDISRKGMFMVESKIKLIRDIAAKLPSNEHESSKLHKILIQINGCGKSKLGGTPAEAILGWTPSMERILSVDPVPLKAPNSKVADSTFDRVDHSKAISHEEVYEDEDMHKRLRCYLEMGEVVSYNGPEDSQPRQAVIQAIEAPQVLLLDLDSGKQVKRHMRYVQLA